MSLYIGIDPGKSGAIAFIDDDHGVWSVKNKETPLDLAHALSDAIGLPLSNPDAKIAAFAFIEKVHSMPGQGVASTFKFGESFGFLQGLLVALSIAHEFVTPVKWQTAMQCRTKGDKNVSKRKAQELFPDQKITHANADALLIAEYCRRKQTGMIVS